MNRLLSLLASVSDGVDVDWDKEEAETDSEADRRLIRSLRIVAKMTEGQSPDITRKSSFRDVQAGRQGTFELLEPIGKGTYGWVWRARDLRLDRWVAIKILEEDGPWLDEARRLATIRHPHVVTIYGIETLETRPALIMELIEGRTLDRILDESGRLGASELVSWGSDLCRALAAVHGAGIVHQDLKAQNVMREEGGRIVLMDFGGRGGTPRYMAPELFRGEPPSIRSDIYSLGILLYHLATGVFPSDARTMDELKQAHEAGALKPVLDVRPDLPPRLAGVIDRAIDLNPARRWASAGDMERALRGGTESEATPDVAIPDPRLRRRNIALITTAFVLAGAAVVWSVMQDRKSAGTLPQSATSVVTTASSPLANHGPSVIPAGYYSIEAAFYRGRKQRVRLDRGDRVAPGDSVSLRIQASAPLHVYVVNEDEAGNAFLLFPSPGLVPENPLPAETPIVLPGEWSREPFYWQVTSGGGTEHLLVIASPRPLPALDQELATLGRPLPGAPIRFPALAPPSRDLVRGLGGLVHDGGADPAPSGKSGGAPAQRLFELAEPLGDRPDTISGVWMRRLELENPAHP
jgi:eukaryotic-like serine/threonine-protein kinase